MSEICQKDRITLLDEVHENRVKGMMKMECAAKIYMRSFYEA